ncbi:hypothetical protein HMPREF1568_1605 [Providencia alcalifaciens PAL-3]|nr:hypothetical protein HMPREF1568_1605 [Providencia alcalifaciens PAL-3]
MLMPSWFVVMAVWFDEAFNVKGSNQFPYYCLSLPMIALKTHQTT